jgi:hypothetical protein
VNKEEKERLVIKLHQENKTMREIASAAHMSFSDIKKIIGRIDGNAGDTDLSNRSNETQALWLFEHKKRPIDVAIELDIPYNRVEELQLTPSSQKMELAYRGQSRLLQPQAPNQQKCPQESPWLSS